MTRRTKIKASENRLKAIELRLLGYTLKDIALALNVSVTMAHKYIVKALNELAEQCAEETRTYRALQVARLEGLLVPAYIAAKDGDINAIEKARKIIDSLSVLMGCNAPSKIAPTTPDGKDPYEPYRNMTSEEIDARIQELQKKN